MMVEKVHREIKWMIVHVAGTKVSMNIDMNWIDRLHRKRGWSGIGYNYFIKLDGTIQKGRSLQKYGAHTLGRGANSKSIGICLEGGMAEDGSPKDTLTHDQWLGIVKIHQEAKVHYHKILLAGHNQFDNKPCPCFDIREYADKHGLGLVTLQDEPRVKLPE